MDEPKLTPAQIVAAFNEWLRKYTEDPDGFRSVTALVLESLAQRAEGKPLTYGDECYAVLTEMAGAAS